jgi:hypothetical protein
MSPFQLLLTYVPFHTICGYVLPWELRMCNSGMCYSGRRGPQDTGCGCTSQGAQCHGGGAPGSHEHGSSSCEFDIHPVAVGSNLIIHDKKTHDSVFIQLISQAAGCIHKINFNITSDFPLLSPMWKLPMVFTNQNFVWFSCLPVHVPSEQF